MSKFRDILSGARKPERQPVQSEPAERMPSPNAPPTLSAEQQRVRAQARRELRREHAENVRFQLDVLDPMTVAAETARAAGDLVKARRIRSDRRRLLDDFEVRKAESVIRATPQQVRDLLTGAIPEPGTKPRKPREPWEPGT